MASVPLTEDEIDDILYFARVNDPAEFKQCLTELSQKRDIFAQDILKSAVDAQSGNTALHYAAANGHSDIMTMIASLYSSSVTAIPDTSAPPSQTSLPPHAPLPSEALAAFINTPNVAGNTALHWAALNGHLPTVKQLVDLGADPGLVNSSGHDAVFEAERNGKAEVVDWFLAEVPGLERAIGSVGENGEGGSAAESEVVMDVAERSEEPAEGRAGDDEEMGDAAG